MYIYIYIYIRPWILYIINPNEVRPWILFKINPRLSIRITYSTLILITYRFQEYKSMTRHHKQKTWSWASWNNTNHYIYIYIYTHISYIKHGIYSQRHNYTETLQQKIKTPRKLFSLILKQNHMLYKRDIEDHFDTNYWKKGFCISYKTHSGSNKYRSTSFMRDNMYLKF